MTKKIIDGKYIYKPAKGKKVKFTYDNTLYSIIVLDHEDDEHIEEKEVK